MFSGAPTVIIYGKQVAHFKIILCRCRFDNVYENDEMCTC